MGGSPGTIETTSTQTSGPPAYAQPYIEQMLQGAQERYESGAPEFFPDATYVPFSPETEQGLAGITQGAQQGSPIASTGMEQMLSTIQGDYLNPDTNPYLKGTIEAAINPVQERLTEETLPQIASYFAGAGRSYSPAQAAELGQATRGANRAMSEAATRAAMQNYLGERGIQANATQQAPDYALRRFDDFNQLLGVGQQREGQAGKELQDAIARWDFGQNQPQQKLAEYGGNIRQGVYGGTGTSTQQTPYFGGSPATAALGAGMSAAGTAGSLGWKPFGTSGGK